MPDLPTALPLSVVVPATDSPPTLDRCLEALRRSAREPDELLVQREAAGPGPAAARNAGARRARGEVLVFVDADVEIRPDALARIEQTFRARPGLAALFGSYDDRPEAPGRVSRFRNLLHHHVHQSSPGPADTFWAGLGAVRRSVFEAVGGFDAERFPHPSVEDIDFGMRLRRAGETILLDPTVLGRHLKAWSLPEMLRTDFARRGVPWVRLQAEQGSAGTALNLGWPHRLSAIAALALAWGVGRPHPRMAIGAGGAMLILNARFYALLGERGGPALAATGLGLHALHHLCAAAAVPVGLLAHARERRRR
jgi:Glycosyl transferase family 2